MKNIHNRMPVRLSLQEAIKYLSDDSESNLEKCQPYKDVNNM